MKKVCTLCFIIKDSKILLGMKKRGFGMGKWNGFGGKVNAGETIEEAAKRELFEEAGIAVKEIEKIGVNDFHFKDETWSMEVHVYKGIDFEGEPSESEEMSPKWFSLEEMPYKKMWIDDPFWMPLFLQGKKFTGKYLFEGTEKLLEHEVLEQNDL